jgi:hypothetical protein
VELIDSHGDTLDVQISQTDLTTLANALNEVIGGAQPIEEWEFQTLIGVTRDEAKAVLTSLSRLLQS